MTAGRSGPLRTACRGLCAAVRAHPWWATGALAITVMVQVLLPPLVLAVVRKPWTYFTFNPWLKRLPEYLVGHATIAEKLDFLSRAALFWFTADGAYGAPEWGFAVDGADLLRFLLVAALVGAWLALWRYGHDLGSGVRRHVGAHHGPTLGLFAGVLGLATGPCSVVGCGAPVLPVIGLAFSGLSSGTVILLSTLSRVSGWMLLTMLVGGVAYQAWLVGMTARTHTPA